MHRQIATLAAILIGIGAPIRASAQLRPSRSALATATTFVGTAPAAWADASRLAPHWHPGAALRRDRESHAIIGGLIGGVVGLVACTAISNLVKDPGSGITTCTAKGYAVFGLGGVALGAIIGSRIR